MSKPKTGKQPDNFTTSRNALLKPTTSPTTNKLRASTKRRSIKPTEESDMNPYHILQQWITELHEQFGDKIPEPQKTQQIVTKVEQTLNTKLEKYLGKGDNGIAFKTNDNSVIKYTIDKNEAILWNRLQNQNLPGIAKLKNVIHLTSSKTGDTYLYVIHVEYIAHDLTQTQKQQINQILKKQPPPTQTTRENYISNRTANLMAQFEDLAEQDQSYQLIPDLLADLADKHQAYIYDLRADNFKTNNNGQIILIDPSVPDLLGKITHPQTILFEEKLNIVLKQITLVIR